MRARNLVASLFIAITLAFIFILISEINTSEASTIGWYGMTLCEDRHHYDCVIIGKEVMEKEVKTGKGTKVVRRIVDPQWEDAFPDEREREIIMKVNRMNYQLRAGYRIAVPRDMDGKTLMNFSPFLKRIYPPGEKVLIFDPALFAWAAYDEHGRLVRWGPAVGGRGGTKTPAGTYRIYSKGGAGCRSRQYPEGCKGKTCTPMPYCMSFKRGYSFHGGYLPGRHQSHGCVRLFYDDAKWLNRSFVNRGTKVIVRPY